MECQTPLADLGSPPRRRQELYCNTDDQNKSGRLPKWCLLDVVDVVRLPSLIPRPKEEEEKGTAFSCSYMCLIAVEFHHLHILLIYFCMFVTPILTLNIKLSVDLS